MLPCVARRIAGSELKTKVGRSMGGLAMARPHRNCIKMGQAVGSRARPRRSQSASERVGLCAVARLPARLRSHALPRRIRGRQRLRRYRLLHGCRGPRLHTGIPRNRRKTGRLKHRGFVPRRWVVKLTHAHLGVFRAIRIRCCGLFCSYEPFLATAAAYRTVAQAGL